MTSRERVLMALNHREPDRVPVDFGGHRSSGIAAIAYAKLKRALAILGELYKSHPKTGDVVISFNRFADSSLNILVVHWWNSTDYNEYLAGMQELNLAIKQRFDAEGIGFAFPTQTLYVKQEPPVPPDRAAPPKAQGLAAT
jgi:small-conductance mechanosensitive channel